MSLNWKEECRKYEIIVLSYMANDSRYIDRVLLHGPIKTMEDFFCDPDCKYIFNILYKYKVKFDQIVIKETFKDIVDNDCINKIIDKADRVRYLDTYDEILLEKENWKPEQFNQVKYEWFQVEIAPKFSELLRAEKTRLDSCRTFKVFENIEELINKYRSLSRVEEGVEVVFLKDYLPILQREFNESITKGSEDQGVLSGIKSLDKHLVDGFSKGKVSLIGGRSSSGKTTLAVNIGTNMMRNGKKVLFMSLEMSKKQLANMMISRMGKIPYYRLLDPKKNDEKWAKFINKIHELKVYDLIANDFCILEASPNTHTWEEYESQIENKIISEGFSPDTIIIDYLALIGLPDIKDKERRDVALGNLTKKIISFAKKTNAALIVLVQANRQSVHKDPKTGKEIIDINLENIEDSNKVGQDAHLFLTINQVINGDNSIKYDVWIKKQRGGAAHVHIPLESQMNVQWITDQDGMYNEPFIFKDPTPEELELHNELFKVDSSNKTKIGTGIDEDDTEVSIEDFSSEYGDTTGGIPKSMQDRPDNSSSYTENENLSMSSKAVGMDDILGNLDEKINEEEPPAISKESKKQKIDLFKVDDEEDEYGKY